MEDYTITGGDGKEYGPVSAMTIREWAQQGRANAQTLVRRGSEPARPLGELPEFSDLFAAPKHAAAGPIKLGTPMANPAGAMPAPTFPETMSTVVGGSNIQESAVIALSEPLSKCGFWLKLMAVLQFLYAGIYIIGSFGIGIIFAWLPVWMGVLMWQAANRARDAALSGDLMTAITAQNKIKLLIIIMGVITLLSIVLALFFIVLIGFIGVSSPSFMEEFRQQLEQNRY